MKLKGLVMTMMAALTAGVWADEPSAELKALMDAYNAGVKQMEAGKADGAKTAFEAVMKDAAASGEAQAKTVLAGAANNLGMILLGQGKAEEAEAAFSQAVGADPTHALAVNNLGTALLRQGKAKEAVAAYERSVKTDPTLGVAANNLARLLIQGGDDQKAAELLSKNLKVSKDGRHEALLLTAGIVCRAKAGTAKQDAVWDLLFGGTDKSPAAREKLLGELVLNGADELALRKAEEGLASDPAWAAGLALKARLTAKAGKTLDALKQFRALVKNTPEDASLRSDLLALLIEKDLLDEAKEQSDAAVKAFPEHSALWFARGRMMERLGDAKEAEASYFNATKFDKANEKAWNNLAVLVEKRGDAKTAVVCYSNALKISPRNSRTLYNLGRLYVTQNIDVKTGVRMLGAATSSGGEGSKEAKKLLDNLQAVAKTQK